jgi:hypothetical protein
MDGNNFTDFFAFTMEESPVKTIAILFCIPCAVALTIPLYFIIWFDSFGSDQTGTFINKLVSMICI